MNVQEKFKYVESDHDFDQNKGWVDYYATKNVPDPTVDPFKPEKGEVDNMSSITIHMFDTDVDASYQGPTMVPYGEGYVEYGEGYVIEDADCEIVVNYIWDCDEITREQYLKINKMSEDELEAIINFLKEEAKSSYIDWLEDNYEPSNDKYLQDYEEQDSNEQVLG